MAARTMTTASSGLEGAGRISRPGRAVRQPSWAWKAIPFVRREAAALKATLQVADPNMAQILRMSQAFARKWGPHVERTVHLFLLVGGHCQAADKVDEHGGEAVSVDALIHSSHDMSKLGCAPGHLLWSEGCACWADVVQPGVQNLVELLDPGFFWALR